VRFVADGIEGAPQEQVPDATLPSALEHASGMTHPARPPGKGGFGRDWVPAGIRADIDAELWQNLPSTLEQGLKKLDAMVSLRFFMIRAPFYINRLQVLESLNTPPDLTIGHL
jgi:hypothetical protein